MATFKYTGRSNNGQEVEGVVKAADKMAAALEIKQSVDIIETLKEVEGSTDFLSKLTEEKIDIKQLSLVCRQFSIILHAGLPIITSIRLVGNQVEGKKLQKLLLDVCDDVKSGAGIGDAFEQRDPTLPTTFIETIRAGEASGKLDIAFDRLSTYYTKRSRTAGKVKSALIYPIAVIIIAVIVVAILMIYAVPSFTKTFESLGTELPWVTKALIGMSDFFVNKWWLLLSIIIAAVLIYRIYTNTDEGKYKVETLKLQVPILGKVSLMSAASEFATTFATMLASGVPAIKALEITAKSISNGSISQDVMKSVNLIKGGYKIGDSLKQTTKLPELLLEIVSVGEGSGSLETTLNVIADFYDNEVDTATTNALAVLEPALICVLAVIVVFILLAVYLPMFSMYDAI